MNEFWKEYWANFKEVLKIVTFVAAVVATFFGIIFITGYFVTQGLFLIALVFLVLSISAGAAALVTILGG